MLPRIIYYLNHISLKYSILRTLGSKFFFRDNVRHKLKVTRISMLTKQ